MKRIKKIRSGLVSRQLTMTKLAIKAGKSYLSNRKLSSVEALRESLDEQVNTLIEELGVMKGSLMKAGQLLSLYGAPFLSEKTQKLLSKLESETNYLGWEEIKKQIPEEWMESLEIERIPIAAASIGQVHIARKNKKTMAMKIQYIGVRRAIKNDIRNLKFFLKAARLVPSELDLNAVALEIQGMLEQETDYLKEAASTTFFKDGLSKYKQYVVPKVLNEYSNEFIITTEFLEGTSIKNLKANELTQDQRNELGKSFLRLLFIELFELECVQSDVHLSNYLVIKRKEELQIGLIDFGATKSPSSSFIKKYQRLIISVAKKDSVEFFKLLHEMNYISKKGVTNQAFLWEYASLLGEPFQGGVYDFGHSNIAERVFSAIPKFFKAVSIGNPPVEAIFLDRKVGGVFFVLQRLKAKFDPLPVLQEFTQKI